MHSVFHFSSFVFQILASRKYIVYHQERFGYVKPNTEFVHGYMEHLSDAGVQDSSLDVVVYVTWFMFSSSVCYSSSETRGPVLHPEHSKCLD